MYAQQELRQQYFQAWQKHQQHMVLTPVEQQIIDVALDHPEYHEVLANPEQYLAYQFPSQHNPFLHMGLHITLREQCASNRPVGIRPILRRLTRRLHESHEAEHRMMQVLAEIVMQAQVHGKLADDDVYLTQLRLLV